MPADWNTPISSTAYISVLDILKARDVDTATLFISDPTNPVEGMIRFVRASNKFQEYLSGVWTDKVLAVVGGGTGGSTAASARTALGIGTMGVQNANAVAVTGGTITGITSLSVGALTVSGGIVAGSGVVGIVDATGKIPALNSTYLASLSAASLTALPAAQLSGLVPTANLGSGTANASSFLRGDQTWVAVPSGVPSGLIGIFDAACPSGWTRVSAFDSKFVAGYPTYGITGGDFDHSHTIASSGSHSHDVKGNTNNNTTLTMGYPTISTPVSPGAGIDVATSYHVHNLDPHNHAIDVSSDSGGGHNHTESTRDNAPPYITVIFCKKD